MIVSQPIPLKRYDWYETVKLNYGVDYLGGGTTHFDLFQIRGIKCWVLRYWVSRGGWFSVRYGSYGAIEFWRWVIAELKSEYPDTIMIAEIYQPELYQSFIELALIYFVR